jgi:hypothetical protein
VEQQIVRDDAEERFVSYAILRQSGSQHSTLEVDLRNDFTTGDNRYPKSCQQTLHLLDRYCKTAVAKTTPSEGTLFVQGGKGGSDDRSKESKTFDKKYWKNKTYFKCNKEGHPATHRPDKEVDDKSIASTMSSVSKLKKEMKTLKKSFAQLKIADSDSESDTDEEASHFQVGDAYQFAQGFRIKLDLREVILLDNQSTMDLFCDQTLVGEIYKDGSTVHLTSNGGTMVATDKAKLPGYRKPVWFSKGAITNIIALKNLRQHSTTSHTIVMI